MVHVKWLWSGSLKPGSCIARLAMQGCNARASFLCLFFISTSGEKEVYFQNSKKCQLSDRPQTVPTMQGLHQQERSVGHSVKRDKRPWTRSLWHHSIRYCGWNSPRHPFAKRSQQSWNKGTTVTSPPGSTMDLHILWVSEIETVRWCKVQGTVNEQEKHSEIKLRWSPWKNILGRNAVYLPLGYSIYHPHLHPD
jgi:hypothetical protein